MPRPFNRRFLITLVLAATTYCNQSVAVAAPYSAGWYRELGIRLTHQENVGRSWSGDMAVSELQPALTVGVGYLAKQSEQFQIDAGLYATRSDHNTVDALDLSVVTANLGIVYQPAMGFEYNWWQAEIAVSHLEHSASSIRDGNLVDASLSLNRWLGLSAIGSVGIAFARFQPDESALQDITPDLTLYGSPFDIDRWEFFAGIDRQLSDNWWLTARYALQSGRVTSSNRVNLAAASERHYDAQALDPAFSRCHANECEIWAVYGFDARLHTVTASLVRSLTNGHIQLSLVHSTTNGAAQTYRDTIVELGWTLNF